MVKRRTATPSRGRPRIFLRVARAGGGAFSFVPTAPVMADVFIHTLSNVLTAHSGRAAVDGEALGALTGVNVAGVADRLGREVDNAIWGEIAREEAAIRADPRRTNDPLLMGVFGVTNRL